LRSPPAQAQHEPLTIPAAAPRCLPAGADGRHAAPDAGPWERREAVKQFRVCWGPQKRGSRLGLRFMLGAPRAEAQSIHNCPCMQHMTAGACQLPLPPRPLCGGSARVLGSISLGLVQAAPQPRLLHAVLNQHCNIIARPLVAPSTQSSRSPSKSCSWGHTCTGTASSTYGHPPRRRVPRSRARRPRPRGVARLS
jgi:hypothetical protein